MNKHKLLLGTLSLVMVSAFLPSAVAQEAQEDGMNAEQRIERLENRLIAIESKVLGEGGGANSTLMADHEARLQALEAESSQIYGTAEEVAHAVERLAQKVDMIAKDLELRLQDIEQDIEGGATVSAEKKSRNSQVGASSHASDNDVKPVPSDISANALYNDAYDLMKKASFASAETWFEAFTDRHPNHTKAENAYYWLGEVRLVRKKPQEALVAFGESIKKFPAGPRAADSLLKMGVAFKQIGKEELAQTTWEKLRRDFPDSSAAQSAKKRLETLN